MHSRRFRSALSFPIHPTDQSLVNLVALSDKTIQQDLQDLDQLDGMEVTGNDGSGEGGQGVVQIHYICTYVCAPWSCTQRLEVLRWFSEKVRGASTGGFVPKDAISEAKLHFGGSAFRETDMKSLLAFAMAVPPKLVDMLQALHFALVSPTQLRLPAKAFANIAGLPESYPYAKAIRILNSTWW